MDTNKCPVTAIDNDQRELQRDIKEESAQAQRHLESRMRWAASYSSPHHTSSTQLAGTELSLQTADRAGGRGEESPEPRLGKGWRLRSSEPKPGSPDYKDEGYKAVTKATEERLTVSSQDEGRGTFSTSNRT